MTTPFSLGLQTAFNLALLFLVAGCEDPTQKANQLVSPSLKTEATASSHENVRPAELSQLGDTEKKEPQVKEPEYPYFYIYKEGAKIVIEGALKSRVQIKGIGNELEIDFPELEIENRLKKESHRHAVGWGNRIGVAVLGDYFRLVKNPAIKYEKGIVTLSGVVENSGTHKKVTQGAITGFADVWTENLVNEIKVGK